MFTRVNALLENYLSSLEDNRGREKQGKKIKISASLLLLSHKPHH
jgi:hypothetical protein